MQEKTTNRKHIDNCMIDANDNQSERNVFKKIIQRQLTGTVTGDTQNHRNIVLINFI